MRRPPRLAKDEELVALAQGGCDDSFGELARRHRGALVRACSRIVGPDLAEDAAQQALLKALLAMRSQTSPPAQIRPWLLRVAHNASIDMVRRQALESGGDPGDSAELEGASRSPVDVIEGRRELRAIVREIGRLPERQRQALLLRAIEGHGYEQIADALDASEGVVRQLIYRARERVRAAAAAVFAPFWLLRLVRRGATAAHGAAASGTAVKVGMAVTAAAGIAAIGGVTVGNHSRTGGPGVAHAATRSPAHARHVPALPVVRIGSEPRPARPRHRRAARPHLRPRPPRRIVRKRSTPPAPAAPSTGVAPPVAHTPARHHSQAPAPASQNTAPPPTAPPHNEPPPSLPPTPDPPAPAAAGHVTSYEQSPGFGGPLTIERAGGESVTAYFGELVTLSCYFVRDGRLVSHETCAKERLQPGTPVALAEHGLNGSGHDVWMHVDLIVPAP